MQLGAEDDRVAWNLNVLKAKPDRPASRTAVIDEFQVRIPQLNTAIGPFFGIVGARAHTAGQFVGPPGKTVIGQLGIERHGGHRRQHVTSFKVFDAQIAVRPAASRGI